MILESNNISLELSLIDEKLNDLMSLSTFISADEYRNINLKTRDWHSKIPYLKEHFFNDKRIDLDKLEKNKFPIKLFSTIPKHTFFDIVATIPIEFQYITANKSDMIILRMDLGDGRYNVIIKKIDNSILEIIKAIFDKITTSRDNKTDYSPIEEAYFEYIHENGRHFLNTEKNIYNSWEEFHSYFISKYNIDIKEYSHIGKYLWQRDFILLDNRAFRNYKVYSLEDQWKDTRVDPIENIETLSIDKKDEEKYFNISALYIDDNGNYWSSKEAYQKYCKFLNI